MKKEKTKETETLEALERGEYRNTNQIALGGVPFSVRDLVVKAPLIARLNAYYVGATGEGKTQLANDFKAYFGDSACYSEGRPDFQPDELFKQINWNVLKRIQSGENIEGEELEQLTKNIQKCLYYVDELNRCPPVVQNYFFNFFDGKLAHQGRILQLGKDGYSVGIATGNLGNGQYSGISDSDIALLNRMHVIANLGHPFLNTTAEDDLNIFSGKKNPRAVVTSGKDISKQVIEMHKDFGEMPVNPLYAVLGVYLSKGLDFLENIKSHSKRAVETAWFHGGVDGIRQDSDEGIIFPMSKRAVMAHIAYVSALEMIAKEQGHEVEIPTMLFADALKLTVPYSGIIHPVFINQKHAGDVYSAFDEAITFSAEEIRRRAGNLEEGVLLAGAGITDSKLADCLKEVEQVPGRWTPVSDAIKSIAQEAQKNPTQESMKLKDAIEKAHSGGKQDAQ